MDSFHRTPLFLSLLLSLLSPSTSFTPDVSTYIDCGAKTSITLSNDSPPRTFIADDDSILLSGKNTISLSNPNNSFSGSLYSTARVSSSIFTYTFNNMETNTSNVLRLHFLPFSAPSYDLSTAKFSVQALKLHILLENFTFSDTVSPTIKEFFLWTDSSDFEVQFIPQINSIAFVSAIEAFTAPPEMLNRSSPISIGNTTINGLLVNQALETVYRVNMPGPLITPKNDTLWRTWVTDDPYIYSAYGSNKTSWSMSLNYVPSEGSSEEIAPPTVYNTARTMNVSNPDFNINITWSFRVDSGYQYLIRLHLCDIISETNSLDKGLVFIVYIMNYSALINNLKISDYTTYPQEPFYIDFIAHVISAQNITVSISLDKTGSKIKNALLNGLEIFKVNNLSGTTNLSPGKENPLAVILRATIGGVIAIALILSCIVVVSIKKRHQKRTPDVKETHLLWSPMTGGVNLIDISSNSSGAITIGASPRVLGLHISFAEIKMATNNFDEKNQIGVGGFGKVYKGVLSNGVEVAVKRASSRSQHGFPEFVNEIEVLSQIRHRHVVSLIGYCDEGSEMIIVYEYMEKGPLRNYLYGNGSLSLSWKQRLEICIEVAKGLHYLHTSFTQTIIHRDIKSTNILLGEGYLAKVSDFGLSKLGASIGETHCSTAVKGTFGYLDPEYFKTQKLTDKSDVYSFGVMLLEVLCARPVIDQFLAREEINLADWALMWISQGQLEKIIDPRLVGERNENSLRKFGEIAEKCLQEYGMDRLAIGDVLWNLEYCLHLQETEVRCQPYEDSGTSEANFPANPFVRWIPSSVVSHGTAGTSGNSSYDNNEGIKLDSSNSAAGRKLKHIVVSIKKRLQKSTPDVKETHLLWSPMTGGVNLIDISSKSSGSETIGASPRVHLGLLISLAQIKIATNNFDENNFIGKGRFGRVYKGVLSSGIEVAVKRASSRSKKYLAEFKSEIFILSQIRHCHLVSLIGYCDECSEMIVIYEYMEKGSLRNYLYGNDFPSLSWKQRLEICIDAAKGLHSLHTSYFQTIIHRDIKSSNILLGAGYLAKLSDFGLTMLGPSIGETFVSTTIKGTVGYLDPEYVKTQKLTDKSDVYSFGVMLLEVLCARPVIDHSLAREEINLTAWALMSLSRGQLEKIIDLRLVGEINENSLRKYGEIAEKCLQEHGMDRPAIGDVLWNLEYCLHLQETEVRCKPYENSGTSGARTIGGATTIGVSPRVLGLHISFAQIKMATDNFDTKNLIGVGGFGKVYKGVLSNGVEVAVKRASSRSQQGFPEFKTEIEVLSQFRHRHLVSLIGYCDEGSEMILVYEYMEKGPLRNYLYGNESSSLSWKQRLEICIEAAKGLHYLHTGYSQTIIHRDVKSTNILLGEGYLAKVSDFGLLKLGSSIGETHCSTVVKGTFGYLDPEYFKTGKLTDKSDVYSFGVMLLEVLCARPVIDQSVAREEINLADWALMWISRGQLEKIIDPRLVGEINENSLRKFGETAEKCLQEYGWDRPAIGDVLWNLEYCLQLQEMEVRHQPYEDSDTSEENFPANPFVRWIPSSVVSHGTAATSGDSHVENNEGIELDLSSSAAI